MTNMYYEQNPSVAHDLHELRVTLLGQEMFFLTDAGVFSKKMVDYGSQVLLNTVDLDEGKRLLDVGCGYGPLGLTLGKVFGVLPTMVDINNRAVDLALQNADKNKVQASIFHSNLYDEVSGTFDYVISNPPIRAGKAVVHEIIQGAYDYLVVSGHLTIVIQKKQGAPSAKAKMEEVFGNCTILKKDKGYYILESVKE
ncbi:class I SAM-dependent methyltransferase [Streptococcus acidominimus]|uniref:Class I SAM-dependent methyltransferase n=1 Tax=Streptococcus acidominimus TaxID=1326 RepID=A0A4Y9FQ85_STRAI|nr:class I SAM-dependent methyltransferase [Streptococcus acidominimus]MBF0818831.1 class I SAM-dependent methyltransferase [Streptococcus acidominimus]MBF0839581.1 class I SAM-dependent methyltransferase [Streptococcus acidominimus]MBF0849245.1 class I SAM-dependent methyltransferase [Streptococcus danieliae]TFU30673.1 class I SAM-dependent methyltransferase [Streptococcus acidominimus]